MLEKDKKEIYNRVMENIAKQVKGMLNETGIAPLPPENTVLKQRLVYIQKVWDKMSHEGKSALLNAIDRIIETDLKGDTQKLKDVWIKTINQ